MTPMTREGVSDPSKLSSDGRKAHYMNRNRPRAQQGYNRAHKKGSAYTQKGFRPSHMDGERA